MPTFRLHRRDVRGFPSKPSRNLGTEDVDDGNERHGEKRDEHAVFGNCQSVVVRQPFQALAQCTPIDC